jgi:hypothetical protein
MSSTARRGHPALVNGDGGYEREEEEDEEGYGAEAEAEPEEEPRLKYQRLGGSVPAILSTDAAAAIAVTDRAVLLGTHDGTLHILDFQGNEVPVRGKLLLARARARNRGVPAVARHWIAPESFPLSLSPPVALLSN